MTHGNLPLSQILTNVIVDGALRVHKPVKSVDCFLSLIGMIELEFMPIDNNLVRVGRVVGPGGLIHELRANGHGAVPDITLHA